MADLFIDADVIGRTKSRLTSVTDLLDGPCRAMRDLPRDAVAQARLRDKLGEFGDEWEWGIGKLGEFSGAASDGLGQILEAFSEAEDELKAVLDEAGEQSR
ncbi:hypothetical protein HMPREF0063_11384 [Aeromicrobium marinum DSM 15272]|uniref:WXG100 family type VII secretion target n=1 Tax=Aeromicrobium marinum DSM 15272 TaxID=585531 RepID=E2SBH5_9ACTN|nr:hypothetical protein [Aeromicrobium marinum]EFQ83721.1 hypothetical protein HMPREF0063_11384 [Aeromicrobium marinum DSM 15272]